MTPEQAQTIIGRIDAVWPTKTPPTTAQYAEWIEFLGAYEFTYAETALRELRTELTWRPSMAHFKHAYLAATAVTEDRLALPGEISEGPSEDDIYGRTHRVHCYRCEMAISLEERGSTAGYTEGRGMYHARCPRPGTAPVMPPSERVERSERLLRTPA